MDIRITNSCNNNCLYCLEQSYRNKDKFINKKDIFLEIKKNKIDKILNIYGGNPLTHPDINEIILYGRQEGFESIGVLTNTHSLNHKTLDQLINNGLTTLGFYFNSFNESAHNEIVNGGINLQYLLENIEIVKKSGISNKAIIHINNQNIKTVYKDIFVLNKKYGIKNIEFVNYFPFDRPYDNFKNILEYSIIENRIYIDNLFKIIIKNDFKVRFVKFSKDFFGSFIDFYDYENGVLKQIGEEDILRLRDVLPFCLKEKRCNDCFIKDNCKFYE
ncbi:MAG: radical SAM protein [Candidatus Gracilibacteria bacterium]